MFKGQSTKSLLLSGLNRRSRSSGSEKFMFGKKRGMHGKDFKIGKKFKKSGKGIMKGSFGAEMKSSSISPSVDEFDEFMNNIGGGGGNKPNVKKRKTSFFSKKKRNEE